MGLAESVAQPQRVAVIGSGVAGLGAAWLLAKAHHVTLIEQASYFGGHSNSVEVPGGDHNVVVDTGFIVYNELNYPNLTRLFAEIGVATADSDMSFAVSLRNGALEYAGTNLAGLFAQPANVVRGRFWRMLWDLRRFYRDARELRREAARDSLTLGQLLARHRYSEAFVDDHLLPMAGAIWSATTAEMAAYPAVAFLDFCLNHGLVQLRARPQWRTVIGGSREYVRRLVASIGNTTRLGCPAVAVERVGLGVQVVLADGQRTTYDQVVLATHADQALALLVAPSARESAVLGAFKYSTNRAVLHEDSSFMPQRRAAWASWNHLGEVGTQPSVTYWMNNLQPLKTRRQLFVTLNPAREPQAALVHREFEYAHPLFDGPALEAQRALPDLQGAGGVWYCGSYFGYGFHEDALESGLWVAEALGGVARPWPWRTEDGRTALSGIPPAAVTA